MSTTLIASMRGRGGSTVKRRGGSFDLDTAPKLLLGSEQQVLVERVGRNRDLDPSATPGDDREDCVFDVGDPHIVLELRRCFSAAASSENDQGSMNFASNTAPVPSTMPSSVQLSSR